MPPPNLTFAFFFAVSIGCGTLLGTSVLWLLDDIAPREVPIDATWERRVIDETTIDLLARQRQAVRRGSRAYLLQDGMVFRLDAGAEPRLVPGVWNAREIYVSNDEVIVLDHTRSAFALREAEGIEPARWLELGKSVDAYNPVAGPRSP